MDFADLAEGWEVWHAEKARAVLTFRPDVFDTDAFPAPCLPTIHLTHGQRGRRPGRHDPDTSDPWYVTLYLEPEISAGQEQFESRTAAREGAREMAAAFLAGDIDYRDCYQVPRPDYLARLDELTGWE